MTELYCAGCLRGPKETHGAWVPGSGYNSAAAYVQNEEGTLDVYSGAYLCDTCYIRLGSPTGHGGFRWTATPEHLRDLGISEGWHAANE